MTNDTVYLLVWQGRQKLLKFDMNLNYLTEELLPIECSALKVTEDGIFSYSGNMCNDMLLSDGLYYNCSFIDDKRGIIWKDLPFQKSYCGHNHFYGITNGYNFSTSLSPEIYFTKPHSDLIYIVTKDSLIKYAKISYKQDGFCNPELEMNPYELHNFLKKESVIKSIYNVFAGKDYIYFNIVIGGEYYQGIASNDNANICHRGGIDPGVGVNTSGVVGRMENEDGLICQISSIHLITMISKKETTLSADLLKLGKKVNANDNPILMFFRKKKV